MTAAQSLRIYEILSLTYKSEDAKAVVEAIEKVVDEKVEIQTQVFEKIVTKDIEVLRTETRNEFSLLRQELYKVFASKEDMANTKVELIKWMVALVLSSIGLTTTIIAFLLSFYFKK